MMRMRFLVWRIFHINQTLSRNPARRPAHDNKDRRGSIARICDFSVLPMRTIVYP